ncbi:MAG TPA: carboxypeptidase regulatory-like domain-containing protein [Pyrinomonadaceae bacterium]|nr:carboxypeptidase regulatory-like domain-containing protein [Pyrinomonadaceae bacterium]
MLGKANKCVGFAARALVLAAALLCVPAARAQSPAATLGGTVLDENGAVIPAVEITVLNLSTAVQRHAVTGGEGAFVVPLLPPGRYTLTAQRDGFATFEYRNVVLNVGDRLALRIRMHVGGVGESVTIIDALSSNVERSASSSVSTVVNRQFVEHLPLNGRSFQSLFELAPGAVLTRTTFNEQGQFSVNGQRANANYFTVDGVSANVGVSAGASPGQAAAGGLPALTVLGGANNLVSLDALEEFRLMTSSYAPEFGRTPGAQVAIATRSGTNELHGSAFEYFRGGALDANDWFANSRGLARPAIRQHDFGATLGGSIRRNRAFFFASYEGMRLRQPQYALTDVPSSGARATAPAQVRPLLNAFPRPNGADLGNGFAEFAAAYTDPSRFDAASLRLDFVVNNRLTAFARTAYAPSRTSQRGGVGTPGSTGQSLNTVNRTALDTQTLTAGATAAFNPKVTGDLRFNWSRARGETELTLDDFGGATPPGDSLLFPPFARPETSGFQVTLRGGLNAGFGTGKNVDNRQRQLNLVGNVSVAHSGHELKVGFDYRRLTPVYGPLNYAQTVIFGDSTTNGVSAAATTGRAFQVKVTADDVPREPVFHNLSLYAQDAARVTPYLTVVYGLRWELNPPPSERNGNHPAVFQGFGNGEGFNLIGVGGTPPARVITFAPRGTPLWRTTYQNFAPRAGAAYLLSPERGTTLRGGLGIFYDLGTGQAAQAFGSVFPYARERLLSNVPFPLTPELAEPPPLNLDPPFGTVYAFAPDLKLPLTVQWSAALEQPLGAGQSLSVSYVGAAGRRLLRQSALIRPNENFAVVRLMTNTSTSDYNALQAVYARRLTRGLQAHVAYTWAHSIDDDSDDSATGLLFFGSFNTRTERGPSSFDVRHSLSGAFSFDLPGPGRKGAARALLRDWSLDAIFRARTATPVNIVRTTGVFTGDLVEALRPDLLEGVPVYLADPTAPGGRRLNPAAFRAVVGRQGSLGRNALRGFGLAQLDLAVRRQFAFGETARVQVRAEFFNVFNHPNFGDPVGDLSNRLFGQSVQTLARSLGTGGVNGGLSPLYQVGGPRSVQLALRFSF